MCPNLLECFLIPSISVGAVHNSKWTNEKSQQPTYGMCPLMKSHILSGIYQDSSTPFVEESERNDQHYHRNYCVLHSVLTPQWVGVGEYCGPLNQPNPTQPHIVIRGWHLMATENDNTERKMFALTLYAPFPPPTTTPTRESQISVSA